MRPVQTVDKLGMSISRGIAVLMCVAACTVPAGASAAHSVGTGEQISWVRRAAGNFVRAELSGNGAGVCGILNAPLRASEHHRTCAQRWSTKLAVLLHEPVARARLRTQQRAIPSAVVIVHGHRATLDLATPLMSGSDQLVWSENCWMVSG